MKPGGAAQRQAAKYRQLPHTADLAWRMRGQSLAELFENAAGALTATMTDRRYLRRRERRTVRWNRRTGRPCWLTGSTTCFIFLIWKDFWAGTSTSSP